MGIDLDALAEKITRPYRTRAQVQSWRWVPHVPTPHQQAFLDLTCQEALYGGAAGGGKSNALLMGALRYVDVPGYSALLLRRTYKDLNQPGALMDRAHDWLRDSGAKWDHENKAYHFPSSAVLKFGYLENENDKYQ